LQSRPINVERWLGNIKRPSYAKVYETFNGFCASTKGQPWQRPEQENSHDQGRIATLLPRFRGDWRFCDFLGLRLPTLRSGDHDRRKTAPAY
jgi:hypothetical protein